MKDDVKKRFIKKLKPFLKRPVFRYEIPSLLQILMDHKTKNVSCTEDTLIIIASIHNKDYVLEIQLLKEKVQISIINPNNMICPYTKYKVFLDSSIQTEYLQDEVTPNYLCSTIRQNKEFKGRYVEQTFLQIIRDIKDLRICEIREKKVYIKKDKFDLYYGTKEYDPDGNLAIIYENRKKNCSQIDQPEDTNFWVSHFPMYDPNNFSKKYS